MAGKDFPLFEPASRADWRKWLRANHAKSTGIWLVFLKGAERQLTYADSVEEALCFGWIDSTMRPIDERRYRQMFTPRKAKSSWSALNKRRIEALVASGKMAAPGQAKIDAAKKDGSWALLDEVEALVVPPDLARALAANKKARAFFDASAPRPVRARCTGSTTSRAPRCAPSASHTSCRRPRRACVRRTRSSRSPGGRDSET